MKKNMKNIRYFIGWAGAVCLLLPSCTKKDLAAINTKPGILSSATPQALFQMATMVTQNSNEYFYDYNRFMFPLAQIFTNNNKGVATNTFTEGSSLSTRYNDFFSTSNDVKFPIGVGNYLTDAERQFNTLPAAEQAKKQSWVPIFHILKAYYAFYVSDVFGSIAYSQAFKAREGIQQPVYDPQQALFDTLDTQLKAAAATLKTAAASSTETTLGNYDLYYGTKADEVTKWIRAANSLRLKIAMRLMKRNPAKLATIANEVISDNVGLMASNDDNWLFQPGNAYFGGSGGNWDPFSGGGGGKGIKGTIDYMWNNSDPRIHLYYQPNNYSQDNINAAIAAGVLAPGSTEPARRYVGSYASPDAANSPTNGRLQSTHTVNSNLTLDTLSSIQDRLISPSNSHTPGVNGTGSATFILISYADVCFMRAELAARGITSENAQVLYNAGIAASISMYDGIANLAQVYNYKAVDPTAIANYLNAPDVAYNPAKALTQIIEQEYINYFLQPNEAWALIKRTGMPNASTPLVYETFMINGQVAPYPRRATLQYPSEANDNYVNQKAAIDAMVADPNFGVPGDNTGRVWWDSK
jgi:hypothetical protein